MKPQEQEDWRERIDTLATEVLLAEDGCKEPAYRNLMSAISTEIKRAKAEGVRLGCIEEASRCVEHEEKAREEERESTTDFIKTIHTELHNGRMEDAYRLLCKFLNALAE